MGPRRVACTAHRGIVPEQRTAFDVVLLQLLSGTAAAAAAAAATSTTAATTTVTVVLRQSLAVVCAGPSMTRYSRQTELLSLLVVCVF